MWTTDDEIKNKQFNLFSLQYMYIRDIKLLDLLTVVIIIINLPK